MAANFKELIKHQLGRLKGLFGEVSLSSFIKDTMRLPYAKTYLLVAAGSVAFFLIVTYPYDMLIRSKLKKMENLLYRSIYIGELNFSIINSIMANNIIVITNGGGEMSTKMADFNLSVNPYTLLLKKDIKCDYQLTNLRYQGDKNRFDCNVNGNIFLDFKSFNDFPVYGTIRIMTQNLSIRINEFNLPDSGGVSPIQLPPIFIKSMLIEGEMNGRKLTLKNMRITGKDLRGSVTGTIDIERFVGNSRLNLRLSIDPNSSLISDFKGLLGRFMDSSNMITIPLRGTFSNPRFEFEGREGRDIREGREMREGKEPPRPPVNLHNQPGNEPNTKGNPPE